VKITHLKTNHITNPLGFAIDNPTFSWIVEDTSDAVQTAAQVIISLDEDFNEVIFDSGKVTGNEIDSIAYRPPMTLQPYTRYYWKVQIWGETETAESEVAWFETAKVDEDWQAEWITPDFNDNQTHPILYQNFDVSSQVVSARAYICGLGLYHADLNGEKVGDEYFTPYCNAYDQWIQYQTFDITDQLQTGSNQILVMLGNGWYKGRYGVGGGVPNIYGNRFALLCELHITLDDGTEQVITTDNTWKAHTSPVIASDIFDGETYDATIDPSIETYGVKPIDIDMSLLEARRSIPVRIMQEVEPVAILHTPAGETVLDMGQNMVGWVRFKIDAPKGTRIRLQYGEILQEGNFFRDNLRTAKAEYIYISDGTPATVEPYFTFYGFQYVKITGWDGDLNIEDFVGCVVYSDMDTIGEIETSNAKVNQLISNVMWSQKDNFLDIPTDCPQRDERLGWTGDIQAFSATACFNMDSAAFLSKFAYDLWQEQSKLGGMVPHIIPMANQNHDCSAAWADVATILPWNLYEFYGDTAILEQQFDSMRAWVDYVKDMDESSGGHRLWTGGRHFGDWLSLDLDPVDADTRRGGTPHAYIASAFYHYSAQLVAKSAKILGKSDHATAYAQLVTEVKTAIQNEFFTPNGRLAIPTQTAHVLALYLDLMSEQHRERILEELIALLEKDDFHLRTGFVGTPYLCRVLSNNGANDIAYRLLLNEDHPSWLYAVNLGATTIWERWSLLDPDGMINETDLRSHSFNHYSYGSIVEWMYRDMCGLNPSTEDAVTGFRHALIEPKPDKSLQWARAKYRSAAGLYESGWHIDDIGHLTITIRIPFNATATVILPDAQLDSVSINDQKWSDAEQIDNRVKLTLVTGHYKITYPMH